MYCIEEHNSLKGFKIKVIPKPIIKDVTTIIIPPKYTRLENEKYNTDSQKIVKGPQ